MLKKTQYQGRPDSQRQTKVGDKACDRAKRGDKEGKGNACYHEAYGVHYTQAHADDHLASQETPHLRIDLAHDAKDGCAPS